MKGQDTDDISTSAEERRVTEGQQADVPQLRIQANRLAMARYGVTPGGLAEAVDVAFNGEVVSQILEQQSVFDLAIRYPEQLRSSDEIISLARVDVPGGGTVPLRELAYVRFDRGPNVISREDVQRKIVVQANVAGRDVGSVVEEIRDGVASRVTLPDGITSIGNYAFAGCGELTLQSFPKSLTTIGAYAFKDCKGLTDLEIPAGVTDIGMGAFQGNELEIPGQR